MKLTWNDLLIQDLDAGLAMKYLAYWAPILPKKRYRVVFLNMLGEWYLQTEDAKYCRISTLSGTNNEIADNDKEFAEMVNRENWQIENLWSTKIFSWKSSGITLGEKQVYAPMPHPFLNKGILTDKVMAMDLAMWQWISAQVFGFVK